MNETVTLTIDAADLLHGVKAVRHAVSKDFARPILTTMCIDGGERGLFLVAADNYRVAIYQLIDATDIDETPEAATLGRRMVPGASLPGIVALLATCGEAERVTVDLTSDHITVTTAAKESLTARLMDGTFPEWRQVVPDTARPGANLALNPAYLMDLGRAAKAEGNVVEVSVGRAWDPVLFTGSAGVYLEVIMPALTGTGYMERKAAEAAEAAEREGAAS